jgi:hypothetical protein
MNLEALLKPIEPKPNKTCIVWRTMESLDEPYKSALKEIAERSAEDGGLSPHQASARIQEAGITISQHSIWRHRIRTCPCRSMTND